MGVLMLVRACSMVLVLYWYLVGFRSVFIAGTVIGTTRTTTTTGNAIGEGGLLLAAAAQQQVLGHRAPRSLSVEIVPGSTVNRYCRRATKSYRY